MIKTSESLFTKEQAQHLIFSFPNDPHFIPKKGEVLWLDGGDGKLSVEKSDKKSTYGKPMWKITTYLKGS